MEGHGLDWSEPPQTRHSRAADARVRQTRSLSGNELITEVRQGHYWVMGCPLQSPLPPKTVPRERLGSQSHLEAREQFQCLVAKGHSGAVCPNPVSTGSPGPSGPFLKGGATGSSDLPFRPQVSHVPCLPPRVRHHGPPHHLLASKDCFWALTAGDMEARQQGPPELCEAERTSPEWCREQQPKPELRP